MVGLARDLERLLRIALVLVRKALAVLVDLVAALGDRGPADVRVVRRGDRAVTLERAHVLDRRAELLAPLHRVAGVARMAVVVRIDHLRDVLGDHGLVAAVAAAGEDQRVAADVLGLAVGPRHADAADVAFGVGIQVGGAGGGGERDALRFHGGKQGRQQLRAETRRRRMHVHAAVAGILEIEDARQRQLVAVDQPVDRLRRLPRDVPGDLVIALAVRLADDVIGEDLGRVVEQPRGALQLGARRRDLSARERGAARRLRIALENQHFSAALVGGERRDRAARAGADDQHLRSGRKTLAFDLQHRHQNLQGIRLIGSPAGRPASSSDSATTGSFRERRRRARAKGNRAG